MDQVPLLDLRRFAETSESSQREFAQALRAAFVEFGFVRLHGHGIEAELIARVYSGFAAFFSFNEALKARYSGVAGGQRGFTPFGIEHAANHGVPDLKEFFHVGQEGPRDDAEWRARVEGYPENVWPSELPTLRSDARMLFVALERVAAELLEALALGFGLPRDRLASMMYGGNSILRAAHYPSTASSRQASDSVVGAGHVLSSDESSRLAFRAAPHEDINLITLLCGATDAGLEILTRSGQWLAVEAVDGEIVADAGDMLARVTNDVVPATTHRVVTPVDCRARDRYSLPFFAHPHSACDLSVLPQFVAAGEVPRFAPITAGAFLEERLREIGLLD